MFKLQLVSNRVTNNDVISAKKYLSKYPDELNNYIGVMISVNPVYDWLEENINNISYKLLRGLITNIIPLGDAGKKYFKPIAHKKTGFIIELWKLYNQLEKMYHEGTLKRVSYLELHRLGYTGEFIGGKCPFDDLIKLIEK